MKKYNIPFSPPDISEKEIEYVCEALKSGWITTGPKTKMLENKLKEYIGTCFLGCLNSATAALEIALRVLGIDEGDEVIVPAYTYTASASVISHAGAKIIFIDSQKDNLEMDYDLLDRAINGNTKAIIPVDVAGVPCDYDRIFDIVNKHRSEFKPSDNEYQKILGRIAIVEDAAHALGASATVNGKYEKVGCFSDFTAYSFHAVKNFTTAEGGALTWNSKVGFDDEKLYKLVQLYSLHGQDKDALAKNTLGAWEYDIIGPWYKCNMTDVLASIGLAQLERYPELLDIRKKIISKYDAAFKPLGIEVLNHYTDKYTGSGHAYITRVPGIDEKTRNEIIVRMAEEGIACNVHFKPLPMMTAYKNMGYDIKDFPNAYNYYCNEITLPLFSKLTDEEVDYIINTYTNIVKEYI